MVIMTLAQHPGNIIAWLFVGLIAGALAGRIARGKGYGCLGDIILGLVGSVIGGLIINPFIKGSIATDFLGTTSVALLGALVLILAVRAVRGSLF
jgi:uncharacterized membrane protein YeaQ/YmgE (transglycosylase-associated protein family)